MFLHTLLLETTSLWPDYQSGL